MLSGLRSLQFRLAVRLAIVYLAATFLVSGILVYQAYQTAGSLEDRELSLRAQDLAHYVTLDATGKPHLDLPRGVAAAYDQAAGTDVFAVRGPDGEVIAAKPASFGSRVAGWPAATDDPSFFRLDDLGAEAKNYYGLSLAVGSPAGPLSISVARAEGADFLVHSVLREFVLDLAWMIPLLVIATLSIGIFAIRSGLKPVREISQMAASIGPNAISVRLPTEGLPNELMPLVAAMNRALDRLEQGFAVQRRFTADAAHELRTPLAIMTAALDGMEGDEELTKLRNDVARMNRLVEQLLRVARLDAVALDVSAAVDLEEIAANVVSTLAPWTLTQGRSIAFAGVGAPTRVRGNAHAIADAIRNLAENAVAHAPAGSEVLVSVTRHGSVSVADRGPGVPPADRERVFDRFWRGNVRDGHGAGLGLAIVSEIAKAHGAGLSVGDNPGGGAVFSLSFALA